MKVCFFYKNRIYVPIRYAADILDADISWDATDRKVILFTRTKETTTARPTTTEATTQTTSETTTQTTTQAPIRYGYMPARYSTRDFTIDLNDIYLASDSAQVSFDFENKSSTPLNIKHRNATLTIDGKKIEITKLFDKMDQRLFSDISPDEKITTYIPFDKYDEDAKNATFTVDIFYNDPLGKTKTETVTFNVVLK